MKKIACFINNSNFLERLRDFCEEERFELVDYMGSSFEYDVSIVVFITDELDKTKDSSLRDTPVCYIASEENSKLDDLMVVDGSFDHIQLRYLVDAVCHGGVLENCLPSVRPVHMDKVFHISNDIFNVERIVYILTKEFVYFLDFQSLEKIRIGLAEMLTNSIEHGNLNISGDDKLNATEEGTYYELINERLSDKTISGRKVIFTYSISSEGVRISLEDEGGGFDVDTIPDPTMQEGLLKLHGRGILITRMYFDEVNYNSSGTRVELIKRF
ncbi:ATP-binding protein [Limisalsivibrio acetivorans]|uniref:ATP-binding protein n=1 Tax=Limisalsivibrio acetivorans TaxID=1304888 RepID=UPI0003B7015B|nr:ATP-binding protein [Limisalsivibrio acetivorans]